MIDVELILDMGGYAWDGALIKNARMHRPHTGEYIRDSDDIEYKVEKITTFVACDILRVEVWPPSCMMRDSLAEWLKRGWRKE